MNVNDFINKAMHQEEIPYVISFSVHKGKATQILNDILREKKEYRNSLYILSRFSILDDAVKKRNCLLKKFVPFEKLSYEELEKDYAECERKIILVFKSALDTLPQKEQSVIKAIHLNGKDVSCYLFNNYYKAAAVSLCSNVYKKINRYCSIIANSYNSFTNEEKIALRDINFLIDLNKEYLKGNEESFNTYSHEILLNGADLIRTFAPNGENICTCLKEYISGTPVVYIANKISKSRTYVNDRIKEGYIYVSTLFWGITDKAALIWFWEEFNE